MNGNVLDAIRGKSMSNKPQCPSCKSDRIRYVQSSVEYHRMNAMPDENGNVELTSLEDSVVDTLFQPYLSCESCHNEFKLDGSLKNDEPIIDPRTNKPLEPMWKRAGFNNNEEYRIYLKNKPKDELP